MVTTTRLRFMRLRKTEYLAACWSMTRRSAVTRRFGVSRSRISLQEFVATRRRAR